MRDIMTRPALTPAEANGLIVPGSGQALAAERSRWAQQFQTVAFYSQDGKLGGPNHYILKDGRTMVELIPGRRAKQDTMIIRKPGEEPDVRRGEWLQYNDALSQLGITWRAYEGTDVV